MLLKELEVCTQTVWQGREVEQEQETMQEASESVQRMMEKTAQNEMSLSEFWEYTKTVKRIERTESEERLPCWKSLLVSVEGELWGMTELTDAGQGEEYVH